MSVNIGVGVTPIIFKAGQYITIASSANISGSISISSQAIAQSMAASTTYTYGGYASDTQIVLSISAGSVGVLITDVGAQASVRQVTLSGDYTLTSGDDGTQFVCTTALTVTVPAGLNPNPQCTFAPPASGSVTFHPTGGANLNGATSDVICSILTNPAPVGLARTSVGDNYGITGPNSFGSLTGAVTDSSILTAYLAANYPPIPTPNKQGGNYTIALADHLGYVFLNPASTDKTFTLPAGLPLNFRCHVGIQSTSAVAGRLIISPASGVTVNYNTSSGAFVHNTTQANIFMGVANATCFAMALLTCNGNLNQFNLGYMTGALTTS